MSDSSTGVDERLALFSAEEKKTDEIRSGRSWNLRSWHLSYSDCFGVVYLVFGILGLVGTLAAAMRWLV